MLKVVSSHFKEDVSWLQHLSFPYLVVSKGEENPNVRNFAVVPNRGLEFGSYLWYLLNDWDNLPEKIAFIHGHRDSYHQQYLIPDALKIFEKSEFAGLNGELSFAMHRLDGEHPWFNRHFPTMWKFLGLDYVRSVPKIAIFQPSTQCVISRNLLKSRGKLFWEKLFNALTSHEAHRHLSLVLEIAWPLIFGMNPENNPYVVEEFRYFFEQRRLPVLIAHPKEAWNSSMSNTVKFDVPDSRKSWISTCSEIFQEFSKVY